MVTFNLLYKNENEIRYEYFPEGDRNSVAGIIGIDVEKEEIFVIQPAERDYLTKIWASEINKMRDRANEMRIEEQRPLLTEEEWPIRTEDSPYYYRYVTKAINKIEKAYNSGEILENGEVFWY